MATLVTGGAGYIGSHLVLALNDMNFDDIIVIDDLSTGHRSAVPAHINFVLGDISDENLVTKVIRDHNVRAVVHFAAKIIVPESVSNPLKYYDSNTNKTRALIKVAVNEGVEHFVFSSTAAVYGEPTVASLDETVTPNPINPYGRSKLMSEWMLADASVAHALKYIALRYFNVAGSDPLGRAGQSTPNATHLVKVATQAALGLRPYVEVYGTDYTTPDGSCLRDYIQVSDLAQAHVNALQYLRAGGQSQVLNCGYGRGYSVLEVLDAVKRVSGVHFEVRFGARRLGDPARIVANSERIREILRWKPSCDSLDTIVGQALAWEKKLSAN